jgi:hypothetical protein
MCSSSRRDQVLLSSDRRWHSTPASLAALCLVGTAVVAIGCRQETPASKASTSKSARTAAATSDAPSSGSAAIEPVRLGMVRPYRRISSNVDVRNTSETLWSISKLETDCGCIQAALQDKVLAPGERAALSLTFEAGSRPGPQQHIVTVHYQAGSLPHTLRIPVEYDVRALLTFDVPGPVLDLGRHDLSELPLEHVFVVRRGDYPVAFDTLRASTEGDPAVTGACSPRREGEWELKLRLSPSTHAGAVRARLLLTPMDGDRLASEPEERQIYANIAGPVQISPPSLLVGVARPGQLFEQRITVIGDTGAAQLLRVHSVRPTKPGMPVPEVRLVTPAGAAGNETLIEVTAPATEGEIDCDILLEAGESTVAVPLAMRVMRSQPGAAPTATGQEARQEHGKPLLEEPFRLWREGKSEEAVAALVSTPWNDRQLEFSHRVLVMTEPEFLKLKPEERETTTLEAIATTRDIRALCREAIRHAEELSAAGETDKARSALVSVRDLGKRLADPQRRMAVVSMVGISIAGDASKRLERLEQNAAERAR